MVILFATQLALFYLYLIIHTARIIILNPLLYFWFEFIPFIILIHLPIKFILQETTFLNFDSCVFNTF